MIGDSPPGEVEPWSLRDIFSYNTLYEGDGLIRKVKFTGRYHGQYISQQQDTDGEGTDGYHEWQHRRFRMGMKFEFENDLTLSVMANVSDDRGGGPLTSGRFFDDWHKFVIEWEPSDDFGIAIGKQKQKITREYSTSSRKILTVERSQIVNEVASDRPWGVTVDFVALGLDHEIGGWIYGADLDSGGEGWRWADFDSRGGMSYRTSIDICDRSELFFDYQYTNNDGGFASAGGSADESLGSKYEHVIALGTESGFGALEVITDLIVGVNREGRDELPSGSDTWGLVIMPSYDLTDRLQAVLRYAYMDKGREQNPQRHDLRPEVADYHTLYTGFNYRIFGNKLKVMGGYEFSSGTDLDRDTDVSGGSWLLAIRTYW